MQDFIDLPFDIQEEFKNKLYDDCHDGYHRYTDEYVSPTSKYSYDQDIYKFF